MIYIRLIILLILCGNQGCTPAQNLGGFASNKILIYGVESMTAQKVYSFNSFYIDFLRDTINLVERPYYKFEEEIVSYDTVRNDHSNLTLKPRYTDKFPEAKLPFKFKKKGSTINIEYKKSGKNYVEPYYRLTPKDSIKRLTYEYLCSDAPYNFAINKFTGRDTVIHFYNFKVRCWIFEENYCRFRSGDGLRKIVYLDKYSLLPIQILTTYFRVGYEGMRSIPFEVSYLDKLEAIVERPYDLKDRKWEFPDCYRK